jgi:tRNA-modifying protein YgfZ
LRRDTGPQTSPPGGYGTATEPASNGGGAVVLDRPSRRFFLVTGRSPAAMLSGLTTGLVPPPPAAIDGGLLRGISAYSALLTPKGRLVSDLRLSRLGTGEEPPFLLDLPAEGTEATLAHLKRYLPPRLARIEEPSESLGLLSVIGTDAPHLVAGLLDANGGSRLDLVRSLEEGDELLVRAETADGVGWPRVLRSGDVIPPAFDLIAPETTISSLRAKLMSEGATDGSPWLWDVLRVERGRPAFGRDLDTDTIPQEGGIEDRAIDHRKGCYTGQEVVVRIRDRGKVNRRIQGLLLGDIEPPEPGTPLYVEGEERPAGETRSALLSPRFQQTAGLGYVRREVPLPGIVRLGSPDGPAVGVREIRPEGWVLSAGDPDSLS